MTDRSLRLAVAMAAAGCLATLTSCLRTTDPDGTTHHLILGFGVVSVKEAPRKAMTVTSANVVGVHVSDQPGMKVGFGYSSSVVTAVSENAPDLRAEVSKRPFGPLVVEFTGTPRTAEPALDTGAVCSRAVAADTVDVPPACSMGH
jgi:hypothetical protein